MNRRIKGILCLVTVMLVSACSTAGKPEQAQGKVSVQDPARIQFNQPLHFSTPDGSDVVLPAGTYRVEKAGDSQLRLVSTGDAPPTLLSAQAMASAPDVPTPVALGARFEADAYDLILLLPGGTALEAHGSESGVLARGFGVLSGSVLRADKGVFLHPDIQVQPKPDLVPTCLSFSVQEVVPNFLTLYSLQTGVRNLGTAAAGGSLAKNGSSTRDVPALQPGQVHTVLFSSANVPLASSVQVDSANQVAESNEQNNIGQQRCQ